MTKDNPWYELEFAIETWLRNRGAMSAENLFTLVRGQLQGVTLGNVVDALNRNDRICGRTVYDLKR